MNDKIIKFYIQVADELCNGKEWCVSGVDAPLRRFAALVVAAEREACATLAENAAFPRYCSELEWDAACKHCAAEIRARGQE
jgi:hypothetical protein